MEHRPKRQRLWRATHEFSLDHNIDEVLEFPRMEVSDEGISQPAVLLLTPEAPRKSHRKSPSALPIPSCPDIPLKAPEPTPAPNMLRPRDSADMPGVQTVVSSIVDIVLDDGTSMVAQVTLPSVPTVPTVVSFPSYGPLTVPAFPTYPPETVPTVPAYPFPSSAAPSATASSPMSIHLPGASSQSVLSSPPSTPLPPGSAMSLPSMSVTSSYFASVSSAGNSSTSTFTSTGHGTTFTGTTTIGHFFSANGTYSAFNSTAATATAHTNSTLLTSISTTSVSHSVTSSSHSTTTESQSSSLLSSGTGLGVGGSGSPTSTGSAGTSASSSAAGGGDSNKTSTPATPVLVGGVVGGVAGFTILLVLLLFILRWKRRQMLNRQLAGAADPEIAPPSTAQSGTAMAEQAAPLANTGFIPFFRRLRPHSGATVATTTTSTERGFQNLGGRKIESVLLTGGDGYGGSGPSKHPGNLSTSSFYRDSQGNTYGGPGSLPSSMYVGPGTPQASPFHQPVGIGGEQDPRASDKEVAVMKPSPARTPVHTQGFGSPPRSNVPPQLPPSIRDGIGRSMPGQDGSRGSKFAEDI